MTKLKNTILKSDQKRKEPPKTDPTKEPKIDPTKEPPHIDPIRSDKINF